MDRKSICSTILEAKNAKKASWESLAKATGMAEVYIASCVYGENSMSEEVADKLCSARMKSPILFMS